MKVYSGKIGVTAKGEFDPIERYIHRPERAEQMLSGLSKKNRTVIARFLRSLGAVVTSFAAAWVVGPDVMGVVDNPLIQSFLVAVVAPTLLAANKYLRFGDDPGEVDEPAEDTSIDEELEDMFPADEDADLFEDIEDLE